MPSRTMVQQKLLKNLTSCIKYRRQNIVPSVDPSGYPSSIPSYLPSVNPSKAPSEQKVGVIQEERRITFEQIKSLENIIASGEIKVD